MKASFSDLTKKELSLYNRVEKIIIELLNNNGNSEIDNNNFINHANNTSSVYLLFCYWNQTHNIEFTVRVSDHQPNVTCNRDVYLYTNEKYSKKQLTEKISKYLKLG
jgi:hypothetical protein